MKKTFIIKLVKIVLKYFVPIVLGYLEGDSHIFQEFVSDMM